MKSPISLTALSRTALVALALTFTVSCLPTGRYAGGAYGTQPSVTGSGGERTEIATTNRSYRPSLAATSFFFGGGGGYGYGRGYHSPGYCRSCGYNPCRCNSRSHDGHGHHDNHSSHKSSSSKHKHAHDTYRIAGGSVGSTKTKPSGYHSLDWYKSRGYDTNKLKLVNEHNQPKGHSKSSSGSSSSSRSSGSSSSSRSSGSSSSKSKSSGSSSKSKSSGSSSKSKSSGSSSKPSSSRRAGKFN